MWTTDLGCAKIHSFSKVNLVPPIYDLCSHLNVRGLQYSSRNGGTKNQISIGNDVWIGRNCTILNGVNVADGTVLGANTVLAKDTKPYGIYIGNPAQLKSYRYSDEIIRKLLEISWWNWSLNKIKSNREFFNLNLKKSKAFDIDKLVK